MDECCENCTYCVINSEEDVLVCLFAIGNGLDVEEADVQNDNRCDEYYPSDGELPVLNIREIEAKVLILKKQ